jgi:hypothetical protein
MEYTYPSATGYTPMSKEEKDRIKKELVNYKGPSIKIVLPEKLVDFFTEVHAIAKKQYDRNPAV